MNGQCTTQLWFGVTSGPQTPAWRRATAKGMGDAAEASHGAMA